MGRVEGEQLAANRMDDGLEGVERERLAANRMDDGQEMEGGQ